MTDTIQEGEGSATEEAVSEENQNEGTEEGTQEDTKSEEGAKEGKTEDAPAKADIDYDNIAIEPEGKPQRTPLEKAKYKQAQLNKEVAKLEGVNEGEDEKPTLDPDKIKADIRQELQGDRAVEIVQEISENPKEREAIVRAWKAGYVNLPGASLTEQLLATQTVINRKRSVGMAELRKNQGTPTNSASGAGAKVTGSMKEPELDSTLKTIIGSDAVWDAKKKGWNLPESGDFVSYAKLKDA